MVNGRGAGGGQQHLQAPQPRSQSPRRLAAPRWTHISFSEPRGMAPSRKELLNAHTEREGGSCSGPSRSHVGSPPLGRPRAPPPDRTLRVAVRGMAASTWNGTSTRSRAYSGKLAPGCLLLGGRHHPSKRGGDTGADRG